MNTDNPMSDVSVDNRHARALGAMRLEGYIRVHPFFIRVHPCSKGLLLASLPNTQ
jgi:hypothetical protein